MTIEEIKLKAKDPEVSAEKIVELLTAYLADHPDDDEALTLRGMKFWSLGKRSECINDYLAAIKLNPNSPAKNALKATYDILNFFNKDLYNP